MGFYQQDILLTDNKLLDGLQIQIFEFLYASYTPLFGVGVEVLAGSDYDVPGDHPTIRTVCVLGTQSLFEIDLGPAGSGPGGGDQESRQAGRGVGKARRTEEEEEEELQQQEEELQEHQQWRQLPEGAARALQRDRDDEEGPLLPLLASPSASSASSSYAQSSLAPAC